MARTGAHFLAVKHPLVKPASAGAGGTPEAPSVSESNGVPTKQRTSARTTLTRAEIAQLAMRALDHLY